MVDRFSVEIYDELLRPGLYSIVFYVTVNLTRANHGVKLDSV